MSWSSPAPSCGPFRRSRPARSTRSCHRAPATRSAPTSSAVTSSARLLYGGQVTLLVGVAAMVTATLLGLLVGAVAGFYGGWADALLMRFTDTMTAPAFFLIVTAVLVLGPGPLDADPGHRLHIVDAGGARDLRRNAALQIARLRAGCRSARRLARCNPVPPRAAAGNSLGGRFGDARHWLRRPHRGRDQLPRPRHSAADALVGQHAAERAAIRLDLTVAGQSCLAR